ncbi:NAD(P)H-hydrate dehydratase [Prochlorococcus marinus]|uniref:NAD(P)H-hydrate dehydratase n=1 Tax=Prochlorococcus marinus TaxID=1219 RepID=UPI0022B4AF8B|nr:NAD(P)H-hydrate dehydratase [Prochlorococcus marinus]
MIVASIHSGFGCFLILNWPQSDSEHLMVSSEQMQNIEKEMFSLGMPVESLMEKVGIGISTWILDRQGLIENGAIVLVGPGHNGGDGLVVARELYLAGVDVSIWCPFPLKKELTQKHFDYAIRIGIENLKQKPDSNSDSLWIESLFGLGQSRIISDEIVHLLNTKKKSSPDKLISIDVPAGLDSDNGNTLSNKSCKASSTLSLGLFKTGLIQDSAIDFVGDLERVDIGIPDKVLAHLPETQPLRISFSDLSDFVWPKPSKSKSKYQRGRVLVIAGSEKYRGAASLALNGALASGTGSVSAFLPNSVSSALWTAQPEVLLLGDLNTFKDGSSGLSKVLDKVDLNRFDSILLGPGLGIAEEKDCFSSDLQDFKGLLVLDADAINRLSITSKGWKWLNDRKGATWLTPHLEEFKRLFPLIDCSNPLKAGIEAAKISSSSVLLKCAHSVISDPEGKTWQIGQVNSSVARTGLGDVLAGFVSGMGASGLASDKRLDTSLLAASALMHAYAGAFCTKGSTASAICTFLSELIKKEST